MILNKQIDMGDLNISPVRDLYRNMREWVEEHEAVFGKVTASDFHIDGHCRNWEYSWLLANLFGKIGKNIVGKKWLDIGSGNTIIPHYLAMQGADVHCFDLDKGEGGQHMPAQREAAKKVYGHEFISTSATATSIPYSDSFFDVVTCISVIEHVESQTADGDLRAMAEICRVLRPGGLLGLTTDVQKEYHEPLVWTKRYQPETLNRITHTPGMKLVGKTDFNIDWKNTNCPMLRASDLSIVSIFMQKELS